jgi:hypothetical protein
MEQLTSKFDWSETSEIAAQLIASNKLTYTQICENLNIGRTTLYRWKRHPDFQERITEHLDNIRQEVRRIGIANVEDRVGRLNDMRSRMQQVIEARADDPSMQDVPGGRTGLMVRTVKRVVVESDVEGTPKSHEVEEFSVDIGLLKELREHEKQAAQELGQWIDKQEVGAPDGGPLIILKLGETVSMEDL